MTWRDVPYKEIALYCSMWRTTDELMEKFNLSRVETWHMCKWISKLHEFQVERRTGFTKRAFMFKTRKFALDDIEKGKE